MKIIKYYKNGKLFEHAYVWECWWWEFEPRILITNSRRLSATNDSSNQWRTWSTKYDFTRNLLQQLQINQKSTRTGTLSIDQHKVLDEIRDALKAVKMCFTLIAVLIAVILVISLTVVALSAINYTKSDSNFQFQDNNITISDLLIQLNNGITSVSTTLESNMSQIFIQLDGLKNDILMQLNNNIMVNSLTTSYV